jgi:membrane protease YdiL (CAAX protease family)
MLNATPIDIAALIVELAPAAAFGFAGDRVAQWMGRWPPAVRIAAPALFVLPYVILTASHHMFRVQWFGLYAALPVVMGWVMMQAAAVDPEQRGNWRDALILLTLGLAVDLRWFDVAWPSGLRGLGNLLLVDAGLYAFLGIRRLSGAGFDFYLQWSDWKTGLRELLFFAPTVLILGIWLGFIHPHANAPGFVKAGLTWVGIFVFVAVPEELFFRAWVQNFLERRIGRRCALLVASILFGLSHFNWRYVLLATIAGIFYGRAWRRERRVPASTITHATVDWLWTWWF